MTTFPVANYWSNAGRTEAEQKQFGEDFLGATKQLPGGLPGTTLTLSSDQITPTREFHLVDTQGGAGTDNLAQILQTNLGDGSYLRLAIVSNSRVVVVKHAAGGTGQISLVGGVDLTMNNTTMFLVLQRNGTVWEERDRFYGTNAAAHRAFYGTPGFGQNTFTGRQEWKKGADLTAASTLTIGTDGNYFFVNGSTTINAISAAPAGTTIKVHFNNAPVIVHSANLYLAGPSISAFPGLVLEFLSEGSGNWRLSSANAGAGVGILDRAVSQVTVANTATEQNFYVFTIPAATLGTARRARAHVTFRLSDNLGTLSNEGIQIKLYYGATLLATAYLITNVTDGSGSDQVGATPQGGMIIATVSNGGATNSQDGHINVMFPTRIAATLVPLPVHLVGGVAINGTFTGRGNATEDSTVAKTFAINVKWDTAAVQKSITMEHAILELL